MTIRVALQCWELAKTDHVPNDWKISSTFFSDTVGVDAKWVANSFMLGNEWIDPHALVCFFLYADAPLYEKYVVDAGKYATFHDALDQYEWPQLPKARRDISGRGEEGMTVEKWDLLFAGAFKLAIPAVPTHPLGPYKFNTASDMMSDDYFKKGTFFKDCAMGFNADTEQVRTEDYYKKKGFVRPYGSPLLEAYARVLSAENHYGLLANLMPSCTVGAVFILNFRKYTTVAPLSTHPKWTNFWPCDDFRPFSVEDSRGLVLKLRNGTITGPSALMWDGIAVSYQHFRIKFPTHADADWIELYASHDSVLGWNCDNLVVKADMLAWQAVLQGHTDELDDGQPLTIAYLDSFFASPLEKERMMASLHNQIVTFDNPVYIFTWNSEGAIKKHKTDEEALLHEIRNVRVRKSFDFIGQCMELMPWNTAALFPSLEVFTKWVPGEKETLLFLLEYRRRQLDTGFEDMAGDEGTRVAASVPNALVRAIARYTKNMDVDNERPTGFPPDLDVYWDHKKLTEATGLRVFEVGFPKDPRNDGQVGMKGVFGPQRQERHILTSFASFLALLASSEDFEPTYVEDRQVAARFRSRLLSLLPKFDVSFQWGHPLYIDKHFVWNTVPEKFLLSIPHPASPQGIRSGAKLEDDYFRLFKRKEMTGEDILVSHFFKRPPTAAEKETGSVMQILAARGDKYRNNKIGSFALDADDAPYYSLGTAVIACALMGTYVPLRPVREDFIEKFIPALHLRPFTLTPQNMVTGVGLKEDFKKALPISPARFWAYLDTFDDLPHYVSDHLGKKIRVQFDEWIKGVFSPEYDRRIRRRLREILYDHLNHDYDAEILIDNDGKTLPALFNKWIDALKSHVNENRGYNIRLLIHEDYETMRSDEGSKMWLVPDADDAWSVFVTDVLNDNVLEFNTLELSGTSVDVRLKTFPLLDPFVPKWPTFRFRPVELLALLGESMIRGGVVINKADVAAVIWKLALRSRNINTASSANLVRGKRTVIFNDPQSLRNAEITYQDGNGMKGLLMVDGIKLPSALTPPFGSNQLEMALFTNDYDAAKILLPDLSRENFDAAVSYLRVGQLARDMYKSLDKRVAKRWIDATKCPVLWMDYSQYQHLGRILDITQKVFLEVDDYRDVSVLSWPYYVWKKTGDNSLNNMLVMTEIDIDLGPYEDKYKSSQADRFVSVRLAGPDYPYHRLVRPAKESEEIAALQTEGASVLVQTLLSTPLSLREKPQLPSGMLLHEEEKLMGRILYPVLMKDFKEMLVAAVKSRWDSAKLTHDFAVDVAEMAIACNMLYQKPEAKDVAARFLFARRTFFWYLVYGGRILYLTPDLKGIEVGFGPEVTVVTDDFRMFYVLCMSGRLSELFTGQELFVYTQLDQRSHFSEKLAKMPAVSPAMRASLDLKGTASRWEHEAAFEGQASGNEALRDLAREVLQYVNDKSDALADGESVVVGHTWKFDMPKETRGSVFPLLDGVYQFYRAHPKVVALGNDIRDYHYIPDHKEILCDLKIWMDEDRESVRMSQAEKELHEVRKLLAESQEKLKAVEAAKLDSDAKLSELEQRIQTTEDSKKAAEQTVVQKQATIDGLEARVREESGKAHDLHERLERAKKNNNEEAVKRFEERLKKKEQAMANLNAALDAAKKERQKASDDVKSLRDELAQLRNKHDEERAGLEQELEREKKNNAELQKKLAVAEARAAEADNLEEVRRLLEENQRKLDEVVRSKVASDARVRELEAQIALVETAKNEADVALKEKSEAIEKLHAEISEASVQYNELKAKVEKARAESDEEAAANFAAEMAAKQGEVSELTEKLIAAENAKQRAGADAEELQRSIDRLTRETDKEKGELTQQLENARKQNDALLAKLTEAEAKAREADKLDQVREELKASKDRLAVVEQAKKASDARAAELAKRAADLEKAKKNADARVTTKAGLISQLQKQIEEKEKTIDSLAEALEAARTEDDDQGAQDHLEALRKQEADMKALRADLADALDQKEGAEREAEDYKKRLDEIESQATAERERLQKELAVARTRNEELETLLLAAEVKAREAEQLSELTRELKENQEKLNAAIRAKVESDARAAELAKQVDQVKKDKKTAENTVAAKQSTIQTLQAKVKEATEKAKKLQEDLDAARREKNEAAVAEFQSQLQSKEAELAQLNANLDAAERDKQQATVRVEELEKTLTEVRENAASERELLQKELVAAREENKRLLERLDAARRKEEGTEKDDSPSAKIFAYALFSLILYGVRAARAEDDESTARLVRESEEKLGPTLREFAEFHQMEAPPAIDLDGQGRVRFRLSRGGTDGRDPWYHLLRILSLVLDEEWAAEEMHVTESAVDALRAVWKPDNLLWLQIVQPFARTNRWSRIGDELDYYAGLLTLPYPQSLAALDPVPFELVQKDLRENRNRTWGLYTAMQFSNVKTPDELLKKLTSRARILPYAQNCTRESADRLRHEGQYMVSETYLEHSAAYAQWAKLPWASIWYDAYRTVVPIDYNPDVVDEENMVVDAKEEERKRKRKKTDGEEDMTATYVAIGAAAGVAVVAAAGLYQVMKKRRYE